MPGISLNLNYAATDPRYPSYRRYVEARKAWESGGKTPQLWLAVQQAQDAYVQAQATYQATRESGTGQAGNTPTVTPDPADPDSGATEDTPDMLNAIEWGKSLMRQWGLSGLESQIIAWAQAGYSGEALAALIRQSPEYAARFPAQAAMAAAGRAMSEAEYIAYERQIAQYEQYYGLPQGFLSGYVTQLLTNDVSAKEVNDRLQLNAAAAYQAPQEVRDALSRLYGVDQGGLTAYYMDPDRAMPMLEQQFAAAQIAGAGDIMGFDYVGRGMAERLSQMGVQYGTALQGFANAARDMSLTRGFGTTVTSQDSLIYGEFGVAGDAQQIERTRRAKINAFQGGGQAYLTAEGVAGAGSANT